MVASCCNYDVVLAVRQLARVKELPSDLLYIFSSLFYWSKDFTIFFFIILHFVFFCRAQRTNESRIASARDATTIYDVENMK